MSNQSIVGVHYRVGKKIGEGSFGVIFEGTNLLNNHQVAIKFEPRKSDAPQLRDEFRTYKILRGCKGIPNAYYYGQEGLHNILVIDLLGPSLEDLFEWCGRKFSVKTVLLLARQMLDRIQTVHENNLIYRDIKPDNFLIGRSGTPTANLVYLVDFGMAKQYQDPTTKQHIPYRERKSLSGTARYMSINTHLGREQSRRDDLESLGHVFLYFLRGSLPWQGLKAATNKQKYERIADKKQSTQIKELCEGFPSQFETYMKYVRNLGFEQRPDYDYLRDLMSEALTQIGERDDGEYDWMKLNGGKGWDSSMKKPNLHGYGHPNPPNAVNRNLHRQQSRAGHHHAKMHTVKRQHTTSHQHITQVGSKPPAEQAAPTPTAAPGQQTQPPVQTATREAPTRSQPPPSKPEATEKRSKFALFFCCA